MTGSKIPFTGLQRQYLNLREQLLSAADDVLRSGVLMDGHHVANLERWLADRNHSRYAITCHSGTSALECIAEFFATESGMPNPPRVLLPSLTYAATANAFMRAGWDLEFIDVDTNGVIDLNKIDLVTSFQAIVLVGLYGAAITHINHAKTWRRILLHEPVIIEDAAQHWLASDCTRMGSAAAISFDPMKNVSASGNGGAIVTGLDDLNEFARAWRNNGKSCHGSAGTNNRMSEIDAAHVLVRSQYIEPWQRRRAEIAHYYLDRFNNTPVRSLIENNYVHEHSFHKFVIDIDHRDLVKTHLDQQGIETRIHYAQPLHELPVFQQWSGPGMLSSASSLARRVLSLPLYPEITDAEVETVADQVLAAVNKLGCNIKA